MSADKYAQFIAEQQRKLSVSGTNAVDLHEKKELSDKQKKIAAQAGDPEKIEGEDFAKLRAQKEEVEQIDEISRKLAIKTLGKRTAEAEEGVFGDDTAAEKADASEKRVRKKFGQKAVNAARKVANKELYGEEIEQLDEVEIDEVRAIQGVHATKMRKAPSITPSKVKYKGRGTKPKVQSDLNIMASYEIPADELKMIEEATQKGELSKIIDHYKNHEKLHKGLADKHAKLATDMHDMGDEDSFEHHYSKSHMHNDEAQRARYKIDHAVALTAKVKARKQMKDAQDAVSKARSAKREWDY